MAALVAATLAQACDRTPQLAAILADRYGRWRIAFAALCALAAGHALAAAGGALLRPMLTPEAGGLLLALSLLFAGGAALFRGSEPDRLEGWRIGALLTGFLGIFILAFGDGAQFVTLALAARAPVPALAAVGATIGSMAVVVPAILLGEAGWRRLPRAAIRWTAAALFVLTGAITGLSAAGLL